MYLPWSKRSSHEIMSSLYRQVEHELQAHSAPSSNSVNDGEGLKACIGQAWHCDSAAVYEREMALIEKLCDAEKRIRIVAYREIIADSTSASSFGAMQAMMIKELHRAKGEELDDELKALCGRMYRRYSLVTAVEKVRSGVATWVSLIACLFLLGLYLCSRSVAHGGLPAALCFVMAMGAWGAAVSTIVRLYAVDIRIDPLINWLSLEKSAFSVWVAPLLGATFAMIFALLLYARLVPIEIFPDFDRCWWKGFSFRPELCNIEKFEKGFNEPYVDLTKLLIWSFIAGWAERLVPDALNSLTSRAMASSPPPR
jgi:hypothetical protein